MRKLSQTMLTISYEVEMEDALVMARSKTDGPRTEAAREAIYQHLQATIVKDEQDTLATLLNEKTQDYWIARDTTGELWAFEQEPKRSGAGIYTSPYTHAEAWYVELSSHQHTEVARGDKLFLKDSRGPFPTY